MCAKKNPPVFVIRRLSPACGVSVHLLTGKGRLLVLSDTDQMNNICHLNSLFDVFVADTDGCCGSFT